MVDKKGYLARCKQAIEFEAFEDELSWLLAGQLSNIAHGERWRPYFDYDFDPGVGPGSVKNHRKGKLAEIIFLDYLEDLGIPCMPRCLLPIRCKGRRPEHVDFWVPRGSSWISVDVKSGVLEQGSSFEDKLGDLDWFGLPVAIEQCRADHLAELVPYVLFEPSIRKGTLIGYATRDEILDAPRVDPPRVPHSCRVVSISKLHPVEELFGFVKTDSSDVEKNRVETVKA